jgi:hypothetical protein
MKKDTPEKTATGQELEYLREVSRAWPLRESVAAKLEANWFTTAHEFSLELLVSTALGVKASGIKSDRIATDMALRLIDTCARHREFNRERTEKLRAIEAEIEAEINALAVTKGEQVPYQKAIKLITQEPRKARAEAQFLILVEFEHTVMREGDLFGDPNTAERRGKVTKRITELEKTGFSTEELLSYRRRFVKACADGIIQKRRTTPKNDLEEPPSAEFATTGRKPATSGKMSAIRGKKAASH